GLADSPGGWSGTATCLELRVLADRRCRSGPFWGLVVAVFIESWEKPSCARPLCERRLILPQPANLFGISLVCRRVSPASFGAAAVPAV
ncbi:hypothetical protein, partial [Klebsiella pneumoniae]|uniref:hypothetical protein n=1 Tax=Klebsiella pneumoniae TaxID=573 RepID=UPI0022B6FCD2